MNEERSQSQRYDEKVKIKEKYTLVLSFRYNRNSRIFRSAIVLLEKKNGFKTVFKIDDSHNFRHVHFGDQKGPAFTFSSKIPIEVKNGEKVIKLPEEWVKFYCIDNGDSLNYYLFNDGPWIICPPLVKLGEKILEISEKVKNSKEIKRLDLPGFFLMFLPEGSEIKTSFIRVEGVDFNDVVDFVTKYCLKKKRID